MHITLILYVGFTKNVFSLFFRRFLIPKFINVAELFLRGERVNSLKRTYFEGGGTCKTNKGGGTGGQNWKF